MKSNSKMKFTFALVLCFILFSNCVEKTIQNSNSTEPEDNVSSNVTDFEPLDEDNSTSFSFLGNLPEESSESNEEDPEDNLKNEDLEDFKVPQNPKEFMDYFEDVMQRTRVRLEELFEQYMPQLIQMSSTVTLSPDCTFDAIRILFGLRKLKPWAIKSEWKVVCYSIMNVSIGH